MFMHFLWKLQDEEMFTVKQLGSAQAVVCLTHISFLHHWNSHHNIFLSKEEIDQWCGQTKCDSCFDWFPLNLIFPINVATRWKNEACQPLQKQSFKNHFSPQSLSPVNSETNGKTVETQSCKMKRTRWWCLDRKRYGSKMVPVCFLLPPGNRQSFSSIS